MTGREHLRFAVEFARRDLASFREGDWLNLRDEIATFVGYGPYTPLEDPTGFITLQLDPHPANATPGQMRALQRDVAALLQLCVKHQVGQKHVLKEADLVNVRTSWTILPWTMIVRRATLAASGTLRDVFLTRLMFLFAHHGTDDIRRCPEKKCGVVFWRGRRDQVYCSRTCLGRVTMRRYRRGSSGEEAATKKEGTR